MEKPNEGPPYEDGSQPVPEHPPEMPTGGRRVGQTVILVLGALVLLAGLLWILVPFGS